MKKEAVKISIAHDESKLLQDLEKYKEEAIQLGASRSELVKTEDIPVSDAIVRKCRIPRCYGYGISAHCPPHAMTPSELKEALKDYKWALLFVRQVPTELLLRNRTDEDRIAAFRSIYDIVRKIEAQAFYDGHYLAFGLSAGSCKGTFCSKHESCRALEGKSCRFPLLARSSMEAVGIDVYKMVASAGWDIFPIGSHAKPEDAPSATLAGIVVIE